MALIHLKEISLHYGLQPLLDGVQLQLERGERVALIGRNGAGKSTLLKILASEVKPDSGEIVCEGSPVVATLQQQANADLNGTLFDVVAGGMGAVAELITRYHHLVQQVAHDPSAALLAALEEAQHQLEAQHGWQLQQRVEATLSRLGLESERLFNTLSGGMQRRVLLGRALVQQPDLLLLDEPTNHLDLESIQWLEEFLLNWNGALLFITHDRYFLQRLATRIIELDRGRMSSFPGDYGNYLRRKEEMLNAETLAADRFDKRLAEEEKWIRQGIKARRTRNEGRVRALEAMRVERSQRRVQLGRVETGTLQANYSGRLVAEAVGVEFHYGERLLVKNFNFTLLRGDRVGLVGPNGVGKTTLIRLLLGELAPQQGSIRLGTQLQPAYFDQHRTPLDENQTLLDAVAEGRSEIEVNGKRQHIISYLGNFLFSPQRVRTPISALSGGERNRLLLAKLLAKPSNLLILDEPTNDLDIETLEVLEEMLLNYSGTIILVSHDRAFLDQVVTTVLAFEGGGQVGEYIGGYESWQHARRQQSASTVAVKSSPPPLKSNPAPERTAPTTRKLSFKQQRELAALPAQIEACEAQQLQIQQQLADPLLYRQNGAQVTQLQQQLRDLESQLTQLYQQWEQLEGAA